MKYFAVMSDKRERKITVEELTDISDSFLLYQAKKHLKNPNEVYGLNEYYTLWGNKEDADKDAKRTKSEWCGNAKSIYESYCRVKITTP